jgi:hypothetical protein
MLSVKNHVKDSVKLCYIAINAANMGRAPLCGGAIGYGF